MSNDVPWWKRTTVYQIYPRSFADSNGDGIGDLRGILHKLDYLEWLGVETLWLSPFFDSPQGDFGYDVSDYLAIAPEYGTLSDCRELIREVHARGMKLVFDMVLNHTSSAHPWFVESRSSRDAPRRDWYIWRDGKKPGGRKPPNNWRSMLGGSGWRYDPATDQWYYASFLEFQPDLNYRNPAVKAAMLDVVRHWLREGVDGLRLDIFNALFKDPSFADNPWSWRPIPSEDNPHGFFQRHRHTIDHPDTIAFSRELRAVVDEFRDPPRFLVGEVFGAPKTLVRYCGEAAEGLHLVFLFKTLGTSFSARALRSLIEELEHSFPEPFCPTYVFGNHDRPRSIHRLGRDPAKARLLATLQMTVRGVPFIYYGEELGMDNHDIPLHEGLDPLAARFRSVPQWFADWLRRRGISLNRDECRAPMQWNDETNAGFTWNRSIPWLPIHPGARSVNVAAQERDSRSLLHCYRNLLALRRELPALGTGRLQWLEVPAPAARVLAFRRTLGDGNDVDVFLNFSARRVTVDLGVRPDCQLFSNLRNARQAVPVRYELQAYEGVLIVPRATPPAQRTTRDAM